METKTVVAGPHGDVPMEENSHRYIGSDPKTVPMTAYYVRRLLAGELVEVETMQTLVTKPGDLGAPVTMGKPFNEVK